MNAIGFDGLFVSLGFIRFVSQMNVKQPVGCNVWFNLIDFGVFFFFSLQHCNKKKRYYWSKRGHDMALERHAGARSTLSNAETGALV